MYLFDEPISPSSILPDLEAGIHLHGVCSRSRDEGQCESQDWELLVKKECELVLEMSTWEYYLTNIPINIQFSY